MIRIFLILLGSVFFILSFSLESYAQTIVLEPENEVYRIGHPLKLFLYDPDLNLDSERAESYSLDLITFHSDKVKVTMGVRGGFQKSFDPKPAVLRETDENSGIFYTVIKIPRQIEGKIIDFGEKIDFEYRDLGSVASVYVGDTSQKFTLRGYISNFGAKIELAKISQTNSESFIAPWVKTSTKSWAAGTVPDSSFIAGIDYMINQKIILLDNPVQGIVDVPEWVKVTAYLWSEGAVSDSEFVNSLSFLIKNGIIR